MPGAAVGCVVFAVAVAITVAITLAVTDSLAYSNAYSHADSVGYRLLLGQRVFDGRGLQRHSERQPESVGRLNVCANRLVVGNVCANRLVVGVGFAVVLRAISLGHHDRCVS